MHFLEGAAVATVFLAIGIWGVARLVGWTHLFEQIHWGRLIALCLSTVTAVNGVILILWYVFVYPPWPEEDYWPNSLFDRYCLLIVIVWYELIAFSPFVLCFFAKHIKRKDRDEKA